MTTAITNPCYCPACKQVVSCRRRYFTGGVEWLCSTCDSVADQVHDDEEDDVGSRLED